MGVVEVLRVGTAAGQIDIEGLSATNAGALCFFGLDGFFAFSVGSLCVLEDVDQLLALLCN